MGKSIEQQYKKLSHREHILQRPDTYIGSTQSELKDVFIVDDVEKFDDIKIIPKLVNFNSGFLKIFDEILVNASDQYIRTGKVKYIKVDIQDDYISIENDGPGIPVEMHKEYKIYVPELIFGHLLTGTNYDDTEDRLVGGKNGLGAKLCNVYSNKFIVETGDGKKFYKQEFSDNLLNIGKPEIKKSKKQITKITFYPDFERFGMEKITINDRKILLKRLIDVAVYTKIKVYYNDKLIPLKNFEDFVKLHTENEVFYEKLQDGWEVGVSQTNIDEFQQVSLVNGITTYQGGTHVNFITNKIVTELKAQLEKKHKKVTIKENDIKSKLFIFLNSKIVNPDFDTQSKEKLKTRLTNKHVGNIEIPKSLIKNLLKSDIIEDIMNYIQIKERAELKKLNKGKKTKVRIAKLDDANLAGTKKSNQCTLFLAEGDSASSTIITGFATTGRDRFGVLPLKGKPMNVRKMSMKKIMENEGIIKIVSALGLEFGKKYKDATELRYGKLVFAGDADDDGTHIKGLLINLFEFFFPELLKINFLYDFVTPIVKIEKGKKVKFFYKLKDYRKWKETKSNGWFITYYKGLGTIEADEIKLFFKTIDKFLVPFKYEGEDIHEVVDLLFNKERSDDRKDWLLNYKPGNVVDKFTEKTTYETFFNKEFIEYSMADNIRNIPSVVDGFKPSQRKILYTLFKKKYKNKVKVSQFAGAITEETAYHHGPASLEQTIINMAQDIVGTNNINLLQPKGSFGTRLKGGKDAASSRYIFTMLSDITKYIFNSDDNSVLTYLNDDGFPIEPDKYIPIIPMILVNGANGIGTGWSSDVLNYNPLDIIKYLVLKIKGKKTNKLKPYFKDFKGDILFDEKKNRWITRGVIKQKNETELIITELPIQMWNDKYYTILDKLEDDKVIKSYTKNDTDKDVNIRVIIQRGTYKTIEKDLYNIFKLETYFSISNMMLFNKHGQINNYSSEDEIIDEFFDIRLEYYDKRKKYQLDKLEYERKIILNKMKFINEILKGNIEIQNRKRIDIEKEMEEMKINRIDESYNYLLNMSLLTLTQEKLKELKQIYVDKKTEIDVLMKTSIKKIWLTELNELFKKLK